MVVRPLFSLVNNFVSAGVVESVVEAEFLVLEVLGEVHFVFGLVDDHLVFRRHAYYVHLEHGKKIKSTGMKRDIKARRTENPPLVILHVVGELGHYTIPKRKIFSVATNAQSTLQIPQFVDST